MLIHLVKTIKQNVFFGFVCANVFLELLTTYFSSLFDSRLNVCVVGLFWKLNVFCFFVCWVLTANASSRHNDCFHVFGLSVREMLFKVRGNDLFYFPAFPTPQKNTCTYSFLLSSYTTKLSWMTLQFIWTLYFSPTWVRHPAASWVCCILKGKHPTPSRTRMIWIWLQLKGGLFWSS